MTPIVINSQTYFYEVIGAKIKVTDGENVLFTKKFKGVEYLPKQLAAYEKQKEWDDFGYLKIVGKILWEDGLDMSDEIKLENLKQMHELSGELIEKINKRRKIST